MLDRFIENIDFKFTIKNLTFLHSKNLFFLDLRILQAKKILTIKLLLNLSRMVQLPYIHRKQETLVHAPKLWAEEISKRKLLFP